MEDRIPGNFHSLSTPEMIKVVVPDRLDRAGFYGSVALGMFKSAAVDVVQGFRWVFTGFSGEPPINDYHSKYINENNAKFFSLAIKHGAIELHPESLLDDDWQSAVED